MKCLLRVLIASSFIIGAQVFVYGQTPIPINDFTDLYQNLVNDPSNGKVLSISQDITVTDTYTITISVNGNAGSSVAGNDHIFDGKNVFRPLSAFVLSSSMAFSNLTITNFHAQDDGGAMNIGINKQIVLSSISYVANVSSNTGGAIYMNTQSSGTFIDLYFNKNSSRGDGGAIFLKRQAFVEFSTVAISTVIFASNTSDSGSGGAVYINNSTAIFSAQTLFDTNKSNLRGGAIYADTSVLIFNASSTFKSNSSNRGGAIYLYNMVVDFSSETFFNANTVTSNGQGGALYISSASVSFSSSVIFNANTANSGMGGAIFLSSASNVDFVEITSFSGNNAQWGGVFYLANEGGISTVSFSKGGLFSSNHATSGGGVFYIATGTVGIPYASFVNNGNNQSASGGVIYMTGGTVMIDSGTFVGNKGVGGVIYMSGGVINISTEPGKPQTVITYSSGTSAGAIYMSGGTLNIGSVLFNMNSGNFAGAIFMSGGVLNTTAAHFNMNNAVASDGGAIYIDNETAVLNFGGPVKFSSNSADSNGGALYIRNRGKITVAQEIVFSSNAAQFHGGAIYIENGTATFSKTAVFDYNKATDNTGGAIYMGGANSFISFGGSVAFTSNSAGGLNGGGAVHAEAGTVIFQEYVSFTSNTAPSGGALYIGAGAKVSISSGGSFIKNISSVSAGGAVYVVGSLTLDISQQNIIFKDNTAQGNIGHDIYAGSGGTITIKGADVDISTLTINGGIHMGTLDEVGSTSLIISSATLYLTSLSTNGFRNIYLNLDEGRLDINTTSTLSLEGGKVWGSGTINKNSANEMKIDSGFASNIDLNINKGKVSVVASDDDDESFSVSMQSLYVADVSTYSGVYQTTDIRQLKPSRTDIAGDATINGTLEIFIDISKSVSNSIWTDGNTSLGSNSRLTVWLTGVGFTDGEKPYDIITTGGLLTGEFKTITYNIDEATVTPHYFENGFQLWVNEIPSALAKYSGLSPSEKTVAAEFDRMYMDNYRVGAMDRDMFEIIYNLNILGQTGEIEELKRALDEFSGVSFINVLRLGAVESEGKVNNLYSHINNLRQSSVWGGVYTQNYELDDDEESSSRLFKSGGSGFSGGIDLYNNGWDLLAGLYVGYLNGWAKQGKDDFAIKEYEAGLYGGWLLDNVRLKANAAFVGNNNISQRQIDLAPYQYNPESDFDAYGFRYGMQGEYVIAIAQEIEVRPFVGIRGGYIKNDEISEFSGGVANLIVKENFYHRMVGTIGIGVGDEIGIFRWYGKGYAGYIIDGAKPLYQIRFSDGGEWMDIYGVQEQIQGGLGAGAEYLFSGRAEGISAFGNADIGFGTKMSQYYLSIGLRYRY